LIPIVNQTMNTASPSATAASSRIQPIAVARPLSLRGLVARFALAIAAAVLAACTLPPRPPETAALAVAFTPARFTDLPGWTDDDVAAAWVPFLISCDALVARADRAAIWRDTCAAARSVDGSDRVAARRFFESHFTVYAIRGPEGDVGLVTGYYEPLLHGSRAPDARFRYPLYAVPDDLVTVELGALYPELEGKRVRGRLDGRRVVPYWSRSEIESGRVSPHAAALAWVDDPLDAFFLQVQGSGRIEMLDGTVMRVGYADQNGHPYRAIGRVLVERGELAADAVSLQAIVAWARAHPDQVPALLDENPSYVFFREVGADPLTRIDGPRGALGVPIAAGRTIAVDARLIPLGAPVWLDTKSPTTSAPLRRLMLAQDTGGAIRGALRYDWFWGFGADAAENAGRMREPVRAWLLWPKGARMP
jgi:membrane-bound lytic murein transglycosylase A